MASFEGDEIRGTIDADEDSILFLSLLKESGWSIYVDGDKVEKLSSVDSTFTGAPIAAGHHDIVLKHKTPYGNIGIILTITGLILFGIIIVARRRKQKHGN